MSLVTFKKKSVAKYGTKVSGIKTHQDFFQPLIACCQAEGGSQKQRSGAAFSLNGATRNIGGVGRTCAMSKSSTPFRGIYAIGATNDPKKDHVVLNVTDSSIEIKGTQDTFVKPTVLSTDGYLERKLMGIRHGQYPNTWVQPNYTGNLIDTISQDSYIYNKSAASAGCQLKTNATSLYQNHILQKGPSLCSSTPALHTFHSLSSNAPYTKTLHQPVDHDTYLRHVRNKTQLYGKPAFPYAVNSGSSIGASGTAVTHSGAACYRLAPVLVPPPSTHKVPTCQKHF
jgi:hypothetical protein